MAEHQFTVVVKGGTREEACAFMQALFYDDATEAPTMVGHLLDRFVGEESSVGWTLNI
ncbi:hypothetical protein [[Mycobacterium] crassicus]|nr:hypothetical protein [Mycolicibacter sp. MYC098]MEB3023335.1 hypothetical protein [Mycolicibacter sp. MYC098]